MASGAGAGAGWIVAGCVLTATCWLVSRDDEFIARPAFAHARKSNSWPAKHPQSREFFDKWNCRKLKSSLADDLNSC